MNDKSNKRQEHEETAKEFVPTPTTAVATIKAAGVDDVVFVAVGAGVVDDAVGANMLIML
ncbi:MAG: hypothetical protein ACREBR_00315 [bacterium]